MFQPAEMTATNTRFGKLMQYLRGRLYRRLLLIAVPGVISVLVVLVAATLITNQMSQQAAAIRQVVQARELGVRLENHLDDFITAADWLLAPDGRYSAPVYTTYQTRLTVDGDTLRNMDVGSFPLDSGLNDQAGKAGVLAHLDTLLQDLNTLNATAARDPAAASTQWTTTVRPRVTGLEGEMEALVNDWDVDAGRAIDDSASFETTSQASILGLTLLAVAVCLIIAILMTTRIMRPVERLRLNMARLARGDLATVVAVPEDSGFDELSALERQYQQTLEILRPLISRIQEDAAHISSSASEISAAATQQASGSSQQAAAINEVTVTVEELNQTAVQIAEAAGSVAAAAEQALVSANRGQEAVRDSILGQAMTKSRVNDITTRILDLSEQSQRVSEVIDLINTIAAQTHILALNAAVESAGAGEYGQRFAVVAAEVKKLAQRSVAATKEVRAIIDQIQAATAAAVMATEEGLKETDRGVGLAHQSGDANEDIISMVERTAQLANAISLATQQQRTASEQVVATMREVAEVTRQGAITSQQASKAANELSAIAGELRGVSQGFKLAPALPPASSDGAGGPGTADRSDLPSAAMVVSLATGEER